MPAAGAIAAAQTAGIDVVLVTGRMFRSVRPYLERASIDVLVVCYQGAIAADPVSGRVLRHVAIPLELARETISAVEREGFQLNCYVDDNLYVSKMTPEARRYADFQPIPICLLYTSPSPTRLGMISYAVFCLK